MSKFAKAVRRNKALIESFFGNIDNIRATQSFSDVMKTFTELEMVKYNQSRFAELSRKINSVKVSEDEQPVSKKKYIDTQIDFTKLRSYSEFMDQRKAGENYLQFLEGNQKLFPEDFNLLFKEEEVEVSPEEYIYQKAGFTPEDVEFYKVYKEKNFVEMQNSIRNRVYGMLPKLKSRGTLSDRLYKTTEDRLKREEVETHRTEKRQKELERPKTRILKGHKITYTDTGDHEITPIPELQDNKFQESLMRKIGYRIVEKEIGDGEKKYLFELPTSEGWEESVEATESEYKAYQTTLEEKGKTTQQKLQEREEVKNQNKPQKKKKKKR